MIVSICAGASSPKEKDGIADYAENLALGLSRHNVETRKVGLRRYEPDGRFYRIAAGEANAADICHVQFNYPYFNGELPHKNRFALFAGQVKKPLVVTAHEVRIGLEPLEKGFRSGASRLAYALLLPVLNAWSLGMHRKIYSSADRVIVHTGDHERAIKALMADRVRPVFIPHGVPEITERDRNLPCEESKRKLGLEGRRVAAIPGFINRRKGYEHAIEALKFLPGDITLLIAGGLMTDNAQEREYYDSLKAMISVKGVSDRVKITGYVAERDMPHIMAAADICLAPFSSSAASGAVSLCIGYNKPVLASDISVNREINRRFECLELFRREDCSDLSAKIATLMNDPARRKRLASAAAIYSDRFSYSNIAAATRDLYESVISESGR